MNTNNIINNTNDNDKVNTDNNDVGYIKKGRPVGTFKQFNSIEEKEEHKRNIKIK
mgnify:FL=1